MTALAPPIPNPAIIARARQDNGYAPVRVGQRLLILVDIGHILGMAA